MTEHVRDSKGYCDIHCPACELTGLKERVKFTQDYESLQFQLQNLRDAVRAHRDARGDDRCWLDDEELYKMLPEGYTPPARDTSVELDLCRKFILNRRHPKTTYISPEREIERLKKLLDGTAQSVREP